MNSALPRSRDWLTNAPYFAVAIFAVAMLLMVWQLQNREHALEKDGLGRDVQWAEQTMRQRLAADADFLTQLARDVNAGTLDANNFQIRANQYLANNPQLANVVWVGNTQRVQWATPFDTLDWLAGELISQRQAQGFEAARESGKSSYSRLSVSDRSGRIIEFYVPVFRGDEPVGAIVGVYPVERMLRQLVPDWFSDKYRLTVVDPEGLPLAQNADVRPASDILVESITFGQPGTGLRLRVAAYQAAGSSMRMLPAVVIVVLSLVIIGSLWVQRSISRRRVQAEKERDRLFNLSLDMLAIFTAEGTFRRANPAFERVLGMSPEQLLGTPLLDLVNVDDVVATADFLRELTQGRQATFENRCRRADGSYRWLMWSINPVPEEKLFYAVAHDITERRAAEESLRAEYAFRRAMEESVITGLRAIDMEGRIIFANPALCRMLGWSREELLGVKPPFPYWPPESRKLCEDNLVMTLSGNSPARGFEMRVMRKNGERFDARFYVSPLIDSEGKQTGWMASINDITEARRARAALEASHERFVTVLDGLASAVFVADAQTDEVLFANRAAKTIFGSDVVGRRAFDLPLCVDAELRIDPRLLTPEDLPQELFDGEVPNAASGCWYHLRERAVRWVDGRVVRMAIATDITDRREIEEMTLQQQERLQETSRLITMGEMASSLAHELNQPLSAIANYNSGCVSRLQSGKFRVDDLLGAMQKASFQAERAGKIIRRVREFVKKSEPNRAPAFLADVVDDAVGFAEIDARKASARIRVELSPDLPLVNIDRIMIEQVLLNLIKNGIEAMHDTPRELRELLVSAVRNDGRMVEVAVADRGHGLPPDKLEKLFAPFYTTKAEGMGMGLNICRSIVEFHDGRLWAEANPGGGSIFRFTVPVETDGG
jgi:PAS domain S-box-containing protein